MFFVLQRTWLACCLTITTSSSCYLLCHCLLVCSPLCHVKIDEADAFYEHLTTFVKKECPGGIGILINNVGVGNEAPLNCEEVPIELEREMIRINCEGTCGMQRTLLPIMKAQEKQVHGRKGAIINISSASETHPSPVLGNQSIHHTGNLSFVCDGHVDVNVDVTTTQLHFLNP